MDNGKISSLKKMSAALAEKRPDLKEALAMLDSVLDAYSEATPEISFKAVLPEDKSVEPMIDLSKLEIDWKLATPLFRQLCGLIGVPLESDDDTALASLLEAGFKAFISRAGGLVACEDNPVSPQIEFVAMLTVRSFLASVIADAAARIDAESTSYKARCPVCGSLPLLSKIQGEDGIRFLVCSACESEWPYQRTKCHSCGCMDTAKFELLVADDDPVTSAFLCSECSTYIKTVDMRAAELAFDALYHSIASAHWDYVAGSKGFQTAAPWRAIDSAN